MSNISVVSFVYNEEKNIEEWMTQLKDHVNEFVIFDLESTDNTFSLCKRYTNRVYRRPYLLCGDFYKQELQHLSKSDWLLWAYPDERFSESFLNSLDKLLQQDRWNAYSLMRHEYLDGIRVCYKSNDDRILAFGTPESPNYQCRLHKNDGRIEYTELVHFEMHGDVVNCALPPEYHMEHFKSSVDQEFDNIRLYVLYKHLVFKYQNTQIEPYKRYIASYIDIIFHSERKNLTGERKIHLSEEFWWEWWKYANTSRITTEEFKTIVGISYEEFLQNNKINCTNKKFFISQNTVDKILKTQKLDA